jgi:hypothetical protein
VVIRTKLKRGMGVVCIVAASNIARDCILLTFVQRRQICEIGRPRFAISRVFTAFVLHWARGDCTEMIVGVGATCGGQDICGEQVFRLLQGYVACLQDHVASRHNVTHIRHR